MYSFKQRASSVVSTCFTALICMTLAYALSALYLERRLDAATELEVLDVNVVRLPPHVTPAQEPQDLVRVSFNLRANFTHVLHWNVKQVYIYVVTSYATSEDSVLQNHITLWDKILVRDEFIQSHLDLIHQPAFAVINAKSKYPWIGDDLRNVTGVLSVHYNLMPYAGFLRFLHSDTLRGSSVRFQVPEDYAVPLQT